jgi:hypothetical protein
MNETAHQLLPGGPKPAAPLAPPARAAPAAWVEALHLAVLTTFAVSQPLFDQLGIRPAFLADSGVGVPALLALTASLALLLPAAVAGLVMLIGRLAPRMRAATTAIAVFLLCVLILLPVVKRMVFLTPAFMIALALALGAGAAWSYFAFGRLRAAVTVAAPAIAVFPAVFLLWSPVSAMFSPPVKIHVERWNPVPVVVVVFDELRGTALLNEREEIDGERFPHFAALARGSTWFRNATTVSPDTMTAVPALLSGRYPTDPNPPLPGALPQNLFALATSTGAYEQTIFEPISNLARTRADVEVPVKRPILSPIKAVIPTLACVYLFHLTPTDLHSSLPEIPRLWFGLRDSTAVNRTQHRGFFRYQWGADRDGQFAHFLDCLKESPQPTLNFIHVLLPHVPWCYLPSGRRYLAESTDWHLLQFDTHGGAADLWGTDELYVEQSQQRQLLQLQYVDRLVGRLTARLRATGLYDRCLLVVTADHGISFRRNEPRRLATAETLADIMPIPLFIKLPGQTSGAVSDRNVESIDLLPTIADVLGIKLQLPVDGSSLLGAAAPERTEKRILIQNGLTSVSTSIVAASRDHNDVLSRFGPGADLDALYRIGPHPELIGQGVENLPLDDGRKVEIELDRSDNNYSSNPATLVPCYFEGRIVSSGAFAAPVRIAVAVNGTIRAVTRTYELDGLRDRWSAMVPEWSLREGSNDVRYYAISGDAPNLRFTTCVVQPGR